MHRHRYVSQSPRGIHCNYLQRRQLLRCLHKPVYVLQFCQETSDHAKSLKRIQGKIALPTQELEGFRYLNHLMVRQEEEH